VDLAEQLGELGVREVPLIGGESYLRHDWLEVIEAVVANNMRCSLVTGGRSFGPERARAAVAAGVSSVSVSIDGVRETHDLLRAVPGSFNAAVAAVKAVHKAGAAATLNTQLNRENLPELAEMGEQLLPLGISGWQFQLTTPMGRAADRERLILQPYQVLEAFPRLEALWKRAKSFRCTMMIANNLGYFGPFEANLRAGGHWLGCLGGRFSLGVQSDGTIKACSSLPANPFGDHNIRTTPLKQILQESAALESVWGRGTDDLWGFCAECYYADVCRGGCVWTAHTLFGRPGNMPYCHHRAIELRSQGKRERLVAKAPAKGESFDRGEWELILEPWE
ncbi:MAG: SPASM domain-containing protein, partial [Proteobacteria bacterium]|nr:SPASM domain-containing protein [Pseudomonadota bacterium]